MSCKMRWISAVLVTVLLATGAAQAWAPAPRPEPGPQQEDGFLVSLWAWLVSLVAEPGESPDEEEPSSIHQKSGCGMDPDGHVYCY